MKFIGSNNHCKCYWLFSTIISFVIVFFNIVASHASEPTQYERAIRAYASGDYETAYSNWQQLGSKGHSDSQYHLGLAYQFGQGVAQDDEIAFDWFQRAAKQGNAYAQYKVGEALSNGAGVVKNSQEAVKWWQVSADNDYAAAKIKLGWAYYNGVGVGRDRQKAIDLLGGAGVVASQDLVAETAIEEAVDANQRGDSNEISNLANTDFTDRIQNAPAAVYASFLQSAAQIMMLAPASPVTVLEKKSGRVRVTVPGGVPAWVYEKYINISENRGVISGEGVRVRPLPSTAKDSTPLGLFAKGDDVRVVDKQGKWVKVIAPQRISAWVDESALKLTKRSKQSERVIVAKVATASDAVNVDYLVEPSVAVNDSARQPQNTNGNPQPAVVLAPGTEVFAAGLDTSPELTRLNAETPVKVIGQQDGWVQVTVPGGVPLWAHGDYLIEGKHSAVINVEGLRARSLPSTAAESIPVSAFNKGDVVRIIARHPPWFKVLAPEWMMAWVPAERIKLLDPIPLQWQTDWQRYRAKTFAQYTPPTSNQ